MADKVMQPKSVALCVLHDADGKIIHIHRTWTYEGGVESSQADVEREAKRVAALMRHDVSKLQTLHAPHEAIGRGKAYRVEGGRLVE